jgi:hypothetical protein
MPEQTKQTTFDEIVTATWARELHPPFCANAEAVGCGSHGSEPQFTPATVKGPVLTDDTGVLYPAAAVCAWMGSTGTTGVHIQLAGAHEYGAVFTVDEARRAAMHILAAADMAENPGAPVLRKPPAA